MNINCHFHILFPKNVLIATESQVSGFMQQNYFVICRHSQLAKIWILQCKLCHFIFVQHHQKQVWCEVYSDLQCHDVHFITLSLIVDANYL